MSKRRSSERGAGETSVRASKLQCPGISGNNAKRAGPFILGKEVTSVCPSSLSLWLKLHAMCNFLPSVHLVRVKEIRKRIYMSVNVKVARCLCVCMPETRM